jgi:hypothetical protein
MTKLQSLAGLFTLRQTRKLNTLFAEAEGTSSATFTIGTEAANAINVAVQLADTDGTAQASLQGVSVFLSDAATGIGIAATAPDGGVAIGTDGAILDATVAGKALWVQTEATGAFDIDITESGADTWYLVVQLPDGNQVVSGAITFAA